MLARSRPHVGVGYLGDVPPGIWSVVQRAWFQPFTTSSNYAREQATWIAIAASFGWLSVVRPDGRALMRSWHVTKEGLTALERQGGFSPQTSEP